MERQIPWPEVYERELVPVIFRPWSVSTVAAAIPRQGEHILDVACGTGIVARQAAQYVGPQGRVVGLDLKAEMIAFARSLPPSSDVAIEWIEGDAVQLPFPDATFDIVFCQGGLQFIHDRHAALHEMFRVLKPFSRLVLMIFREIQHSPGFAVMAEKITPYVNPLIVENIVAPFSLGDTDQVRTLVKEAGFQRISIHQETKMTHFHSAEHFVRSRLVGSSTRSSMNEQALANAIREVSTALQPYEVNGELSFPMTGYLLLAHKE